MSESFLGVGKSLLGRRWTGPGEEAERIGAAIAQANGLPDIVGRVLARCGATPQTAASYLSPSLRELTPDPSTLRDMDSAAERFLRAVDGDESIAVFADYDVDGGASAALILNWLRQLGKTATLYVPDRIEEGYGPNEAAMRALAGAHSLIVCVDCGTLSHGPVAAAREAGADVIVLDHHLGGESLPVAAALVNPNRQDESGDLGYLCAAGVVFLFLVALNRLMRGGGRTGPELRDMLDLAALATVADVAPLVGFNRALVRQGLKVMAARKRPGLRALADVARMTSAPNAYHLGFLLGPRVNAGGRIGAADLGARLLATADENEAAALAERLDALNAERQRIEAEVLAQAMEQAQTRDISGPLVWAAGEGWHAGVVGIVAGRLKEAFNRPAVVIGLDGEAGKGSGRSVGGVDLGHAVAACMREGLIEAGGGHRMAAGLSLTRTQVEPAMQRLGELLGRQGAAAAGPRDLRLDGMIAPGGATLDLIERLEQAGPFGAGAPAPRLAVAAARIAFAKPAGETHLRLTLADAGGGRLDAIAFGAFEGPLGPALTSHRGAPFHFAGRLEIDDWGGRRRPKLRLEDAAPVA
ncbi:MAG: single-stranded-DNA-specific exonuclease RecJ [Paracoccaceae bacterium]